MAVGYYSMGQGARGFIQGLDTTKSGAGSQVYFNELAEALFTGVALDGAGKAYVSGWGGWRFPTTPDAFQSVNRGQEEMFLVKLDTTKAGSSALLFSTYYGGGHSEEGGNLAKDAVGDIFVAGTTFILDIPEAPTDFPVTAGALFPARPGPTVSFLLKFSDAAPPTTPTPTPTPAPTPTPTRSASNVSAASYASGSLRRTRSSPPSAPTWR